MIDRPKFKEIAYEMGHTVIPEKYNICQFKMDGIWGCMVIKDGQITIYSRTGQIKHEEQFPDPNIDMVLLGEYMKGSHWGHKMGIDGRFYAFDCVELHGIDITSQSYDYRYRKCKEELEYLLMHIEWLDCTETFDVDGWQEIWSFYVDGEGYEGLIFKDSNATYHEKGAWARMKNVVEIDYICVGFRPADKGTKYEGQVGAVIGTLIDKDVHVTCSGISEDMRKAFTKYPERYIGQVFTAKGNSWYPTGAVRHPMFRFWRDDKFPEECTYEQIPESVRCI